MLRNTITTRCLGKFAGFGLMAGGLLFGPTSTLFAQSGVDNSTATGVFQLEGDTDTTAICFLSPANGGPAIATPNKAGTSVDSNGCPTVKNVGNTTTPTPATWNYINWATTADDWASFAFSGNVFGNKAHALFTPDIVNDAVNSSSDDTFLGSSSKDTQDITAWTWNPHGTQDKDDIEHAGAAAYHLANGHTAIMAFMDRYGNSGDSTAGFWFVQDSTFALCTGNGTAAGASGNVPNSACKATGTFVGQHFDGDLLIVSDFSTGGAVSTINIFKWSGNGSGGSLTGPVVTLSPAPCDPTTGNASFCGIVNNAFTQQLGRKGLYLSAANVGSDGWSYSCKGCSTSNQYQTGEFLEIGVDLNAIFGDNLPCFSSFFAETRSSTSSTASLSDLTRPTAFPLCSASAGGSCSAGSIQNGGTQFQQNFNITITNTGSSTIYAPTLTSVTLPSNLVAAASCPATAPAGYTYANSTQQAGCLAFATSGFSSTTIAGSGTSSLAGTFLSTVNYTSTTNVSATVTASSSNTGTPQNISAGSGSAELSSCAPSVQGNLYISKKCNTCMATATTTAGAVLAVQVNEGVQYCNDKTTDVTINNITILDCRGDFQPATGGTCASGYHQSGSYCCSSAWVTLGSSLSLPASNGVTASCNTVAGSSNPGDINSCSSGNCSFSDTVIASGTGLGGVGTVTPAGGPASASCPLCPINTTCAPPTF